MVVDEPKAPGADAARLAILLEALEIFAHDLSNPLQSLIVLTELALDDAPPASEDELRCRQTLEAAERMRTLVTGLAGLTRGADGPRNTKTTVERFVEVLSRRWERHRIELRVDLGPAERTPSPPELDAALLNLGLGALAAATEAGGAFVFSVVGSDVDAEGAAPRCALEVGLTRVDPDGTTTPMELHERHVQRTEQLLAGSGVRARHKGARVSLEFSPEAMR